MTDGPMIYLASASPRRRELLTQLGLRFETLPSNVLEEQRAGEPPEEYVLRVAVDKARFVARLIAERGLPVWPVLGVDTEVVLDDEVLGKPRDRDHAVTMLRRLSGRSHRVLSALCVVHGADEHTAISESEVTFCALSHAQIQRYWETGEPADKAGGYAVQGRAAGFIERLDGSYSGVMGLPLYELAELLRKAGIDWP
ncbi:MAG TPA: Maf family protein [Acidiferrobacterales bacterium]